MTAESLPHPGVIPRIPILVSFVVFAIATVAAAGNKKLDQAWEEYHYQSYEKCLAIFGEVLGDPRSTPDDAFQARLGRAMIAQFRQPGNDLDRAIAGYRRLLADMPPRHRLAPCTHLLMARAFAAKQPPMTDSAAACIAKLRHAWPSSPEAQESVVDLAQLAMVPPSRENLAKTVALLEEELAKNPSGPFAPVSHLYCADLCLTIGLYRQSRDHYIAVVDRGVPTFKELATYLFRIANISDKALGDPKTAIAYYRLFLDKIQNEPRRMYCRERIGQLGRTLRETGKAGS